MNNRANAAAEAEAGGDEIGSLAQCEEGPRLESGDSKANKTIAALYQKTENCLSTHVRRTSPVIRKSNDSRQTQIAVRFRERVGDRANSQFIIETLSLHRPCIFIVAYR